LAKELHGDDPGSDEQDDGPDLDQWADYAEPRRD
jgi:hypothetical protein